MSNKHLHFKLHFVYFLTNYFFQGLFKKIIYFIYFWLCWVFVAAHRLSLFVASRATLRCGVRAYCGSFSCCGARALGVRASVVVARGLSSCGTQAQYLWRTGLVAPWHVRSSRTRAQTRVPGIGRRILNHCATREVPSYTFEVQLYEQLLYGLGYSPLRSFGKCIR